MVIVVRDSSGFGTLILSETLGRNAVAYRHVICQ
jgi:hypothetical protein